MPLGVNAQGRALSSPKVFQLAVTIASRWHLNSMHFSLFPSPNTDATVGISIRIRDSGKGNKNLMKQKLVKLG